jgi:hypothetical protein
VNRLPLLRAVLFFSIAGCVVKYGSDSRPVYGVRNYDQMHAFARQLRRLRATEQAELERARALEREEVPDAG